MVAYESALNGERFDEWAEDDQPPVSHGHAKIDWVIVGGESGPKARPMHPDWARSLRDQCEAAGVPFLFKQWGHWQVVDGSTGKAAFHAVGKKASGRLLDGVVHDAFPVTSLDVGAACGRALARGAK